MLQVFFEVVLPVALVAIAGGLIGRWKQVTVAPVSALVFYLFSPSLVFRSLSTTTVSADVSARISAVLLVTFLVMWAAAAAWSFFARHDAPMRAAFALGATTPNQGNMGLPVAFLAFGQPGLDIAVMNFIAGVVLTNTGGIAIASMAGGSVKAALKAPLRYPAIYAAAAGLAVRVSGIDLPKTVTVPVNSLGDAAVPVMLVVLGLQLQQALGRDHLLDTAAVNLGRLLIAPVVAWGACMLVGLHGVEQDTLVVLAAMPTAVVATIMATEFGARPSFVTRIVVTSTVLSMLTLTALIALVR